MKTTLKIALFFIFCSMYLFAQDMEAMQKAYEAAITPGKEHKMLSETVGQWKTKTTSYMMGQKMTSEGTMEADMMMGGRYLRSRFMGTMYGMPFEGQNIEGYDNVRKQYYSSWVDNMGTGFTNATGTYDEKTKILTYTGKTPNPMTGLDETFKNTFQKVSDTKYMFIMYMLSEGQEVKVMEMEIYK